MTTLPVPPGYERLDIAGVLRWLAAHPALSARLGGSPEAWQIREVSDGNLNVVYVVTGTTGGVCVKQSLPYVRVAGEGWPMPLERAYFEQLYLRTSEPYVNSLAPALLHYDPERFCDGDGIARRAHHPAPRPGSGPTLSARGAFRRRICRSQGLRDLHVRRPFEEVNERLAAFTQNHALLRITVDLIFTHPYVVNERNRWTTPQLDATVTALRADTELKSAVARLGHRFLTVHEALLHGDLHTGSVMVTATDTRVIDAEFAAYGPIGFDLGLFVGNLLMACFSQPGHESAPASGPGMATGSWRKSVNSGASSSQSSKHCGPRKEPATPTRAPSSTPSLTTRTLPWSVAGGSTDF